MAPASSLLSSFTSMPVCAVNFSSVPSDRANESCVTRVIDVPLAAAVFTESAEIAAVVGLSKHFALDEDESSPHAVKASATTLMTREATRGRRTIMISSAGITQIRFTGRRRRAVLSARCPELPDSIDCLVDANARPQAFATGFADERLREEPEAQLGSGWRNNAAALRCVILAISSGGYLPSVRRANSCVSGHVESACG